MIVESAPVVVWMTDQENHCTYLSKYWHEFTGRDPETDLGYGWKVALHPDDSERAAQDLIDASQWLTPCRGEYRVLHANGGYGWLHSHGVPHFNADGSYAGYIGTCVDITQHERDKRAGVEVQTSLVLGQEAERKRVAKELHDDIVQRLALLGLELSEAEQLCLTASPTLEGKLTTLRQHVESIALDVHRISHNLHPSALVHLGLVSALRGLCHEFSEQTHIAIDFTTDVASVQTSQDVGIAFYRVTQECLTNIARHSGSRRALVALGGGSGVLHLTISDMGVGFDTERPPSVVGLGLVSITERARMIGADVRITSAPSQGTTIALRVPMETGSTGQGRDDRIPTSGE